MESSVENPDKEISKSGCFFCIGEETAFVHEDGDKPGAGGTSSKSGVLDACFDVWMVRSAFRFLVALDLRHGVLVARFSFLLFGVGS